MKDKSWYLYVAECSDKTLYTGITTDVNRRITEHNDTEKAAKYTRGRRPISLIYWQEYASQSEATKAEITFKKLSRKEKDKKISQRLLELMNKR